MASPSRASTRSKTRKQVRTKRGVGLVSLVLDLILSLLTLDVAQPGGSKELDASVTSFNTPTTSYSPPEKASHGSNDGAVNLPAISTVRGNGDDASVSLGVNRSTCSTSHGSVTLPPIKTHTGGNIKEAETVSFSSSPSYQDDHEGVSDVTQSLIPADPPVDSNQSHNIASLSLFRQLEQADYSASEEEEEEMSGSDTSALSQEEDGGTDDEIEDEPPKIPDLQFVSELPWPAVLRYVRESESAANQYFSLGNKDKVERRNKEARAMFAGKNTKEGPAPAVMAEDVAVVEESHKEDGSMFCHFCGKRLPRRSLLAETQDIDNMKEQVIKLGVGL